MNQPPYPPNGPHPWPHGRRPATAPRRASNKGIVAVMAVVGLLVIGVPAAFYLFKKLKYAPTPSAHVVGPHVVVTVKWASDIDEVRVGEHSAKGAYGSARLTLPAEKWGAGRHEIEVELVEDGDVDVVRVPVDIPESALEPYLTVRCPSSSGQQVEVSGDHFEGTGGKPAKCGIHHEGERAVLLSVETNFDAKLTMDGEPIAVEGGRASMHLPLLPILAKHLVVDGEGQLHATQAESTTVRMKVERESGALDSELTITMSESLRRHLERQLLEATTPPIRWLDGVGSPDRKNVLYVEQPFEANHRGKDVTFRGETRLMAAAGTRAIDAGLVAIAEAGEHTPWVCKGYTGTGHLKVVVLTHELDVTVYDRRGHRVASRKFPQPKLDCPDHVSGRSGETIRYRQRAGWTSVSAWLRTVR